MKVIAIFGAPRSGTSWLGQLFNSSPEVGYRFQPLFSFAFKNRLHKQSTSNDIEEFHKDLLKTEDDFVLQKQNISGNEGLSFNKDALTHLVWKEVRYHQLVETLLKHSSIKIIGIVRHPCAVINSWLRAPKEFDKAWKHEDEWRFANKKNLGRPEEYNGFEKWKEIAFLYQRLAKDHAAQFYLVKYEDLNTRSEEIVKQLYEFAGLKWNTQTAEFIEQSKQTISGDPYGVFRAQQENHSWKKELNPMISQEILNHPDYLLLNSFYQWNI